MNAIHQNATRKEMSSMNHRMEILAASFPGLRHARGIQPWDALHLDNWASGPAPGHGARCAAQFILTVWNPSAEWECGRFDLMEALACWDAEHRFAFLEWVVKPWWP